MIYIVDNILNYLIYLFITYFGFKLNPRKNKFLLGTSVLIMLFAGAFNQYFDSNSPITYIFWSVLSIILFFDDCLGHLLLLSAALMYFTGIIDTFSVMLVQIVLASQLYNRARLRQLRRRKVQKILAVRHARHG